MNELHPWLFDAVSIFYHVLLCTTVFGILCCIWSEFATLYHPRMSVALRDSAVRGRSINLRVEVTAEAEPFPSHLFPAYPDSVGVRQT